MIWKGVGVKVRLNWGNVYLTIHVSWILVELVQKNVPRSFVAVERMNVTNIFCTDRHFNWIHVWNLSLYFFSISKISAPPIVGIEEEDSIWVQVAHVGILIVLALAIIIGLCILSFYFHKQMNTTKKQLASNPEPNHLSPLIPEMPVLEHITLQNEVEVIINDIELSEVNLWLMKYVLS